MPGWRIALWVSLVLLVLLFLYFVRGVLLPFILSFVIAILLEPTVRMLRLRGLSRSVAVTLVILTFFGAGAGAIILGAPSVAREAQALTYRVQDLTTSLSKVDESQNFFVRWKPEVQLNDSPTTGGQIDRLLVKYSSSLERLGLPTTRRGFMEQYVDRNRPQIVAAVKNFSNSMFGFLTGLFSQVLFLAIIPILVPLILMEMEDIKRRTPRWIPPAFRASVMTLGADIGSVFTRYMRGVATVLLMYSAAMTLLLWLLGVPSWILLGPVFGILYLIPFIGNIISAITVFAIIGFGGVTGQFFHPFDNAWAYAGLATTLYLIVGWIFDHLIYPQMVGNSVGLSPVVSMFVIFCGGALFGLPGMLIAFPLAGSVKVILDRLIRFTSTSQEGVQLPTVPLRHREV